jgi:hypothetical protein
MPIFFVAQKNIIGVALTSTARVEFVDAFRHPAQVLVPVYAYDIIR